MPRSTRADRVAAARPDLRFPLAVLAALVLPYVVFSTASDDMLRESKLLVEAVGAGAALFFLARAGAPRPRLGGGLLARAAGLSLLAALALAALSALAHGGTTFDPLTLVAVGAPLALAFAAASDEGERIAPQTLKLLAYVGAASGLLAALQRLLGGVFRLPVASPERRFLASALIGNPGDVGAALVLPALLLWMKAVDPGAKRRVRLFALAGLFGTLLGLGATEAIGPLVAIGVGLALHAVGDLRRRAPYLVGAAVIALAAAAVTGIGPRVLEKIGQVRRGELAAASTQRDIGILAAAEMVRAHPILGVGPGGYENAFIPAHISAEDRRKRRFVHLSEAAHFENAHNEPLTLAAELGLPGGFLAVTALAAVLCGLLVSTLRESRSEKTGSVSAEALLAFLGAGAVLSLASFPLRIPIAAGPFAFVFGLALRRIGALSTSEAEAGAAPTTAGRPLLAALSVALAVAGLARGASAYLLARGEEDLRNAAVSDGPDRRLLLDGAKGELSRAASLRPRKPSAYIALGSIARLDGDMETAWSETRRSFLLEERAETDVNLGLVALARGNAALAHELFVRAVWIQPRLSATLPESADAALVETEVAEQEAALKVGGHPPLVPTPLPASP